MIAGVINFRAKPIAMSPITPVVFIVDDDESVRESLEALLKFAGWRSEAFSTAQEFLAHPPALGPSCLLLDIGLPDVNGLKLQEHVAVDRLDMPIIFITGNGDVPMTVQAMKAGAVEFLMKPLGQETVLAAVESAIERSKVLRDQNAAVTALRDRYALLSGRERQVMALVTAGLMNKQVAGKLGISEITVKAHRGKVMKKMGVRSVAALVKMAESLHLSPDRNNEV